MPDIVQYFIKFSVSLVAVYLFYLVILRPLTFYNWNRWYLLSYSLLCFFIPFIDISPVLARNELADNTVIGFIPVMDNYSEKGKGFFSNFDRWDWILVLFLTGVIVMAIRLIIQYFSYYRLRRSASLLSDQPVKLYQVNKNIIPFSFGNSIFINQQQHTEEELNEIIRHEFIHVKQQHTIDILLSEIVLLFNWYNPFAWLLRKTIRQNLEFIADQHVLKNGLNKKEYQYLLLKVVGISSFSIGNQFNFSSLKKRIIMMNKMKSARLHLVKFLFIVPLLAVLLLSFRKNIRELILHEIPSEKTMSAKVPVIISNEKSNSANVGKAASDRSVKPGIKLQTSADQTRKLISVIDTLPKVISLKVQPTPEVIIKPIQSDKDLMIDASLKGPLQVIGYRGISRETDPLYVLNGEVLPANFDVNVINPERIESISVLKDKSAINKYGDQAKNGVIEINTKKGYNLEKAVVRKPDLSDFNGICIVDGKEYDSRSFSKLDLDPSDIESVNVYKDQSAIDKYGEKGKNGVIEIRLKNGNTGMPPLSKDTTRPVSGRANIKE